jgi:hypothetical protein
MSMKNSNDTIVNRTRDIPVCSAVPQPAATAAHSGLLYEMFKFPLNLITNDNLT